MAKFDEMRNEVEGIKTDILTNEKGVKELQQGAVVAEKVTWQLQKDVTQLEASLEKLRDAAAQVCSCTCTAGFNARMKLQSPVWLHTRN